MSGIIAGQCTDCAAIKFPWGLLCERCGSRDHIEARLSAGTVEETTIVYPRDGAAPIPLALVHVDEAGAVVAYLAAAATSGDAVTLHLREGRIVAEPAKPADE